MPGYITGFSVYTLAMLGVIFVALVVVKKCLTITPGKNKNNYLKVENCLNLEPRKNLYVVKAGREKFLIASSGDNCNFMTKLEENSFFKAEDCKTELIPDIGADKDIPNEKSLKSKAGKYFTGMF